MSLPILLRRVSELTFISSQQSRRRIGCDEGMQIAVLYYSRCCEKRVTAKPERDSRDRSSREPSHGESEKVGSPLLPLETANVENSPVLIAL